MNSLQVDVPVTRSLASEQSAIHCGEGGGTPVLRPRTPGPEEVEKRTKIRVIQEEGLEGCGGELTCQVPGTL